MTTTSIPTSPGGDTREVRALALYRERGHEILRSAPYMYNVPSSTGDGFYVVNYRRESCECLDFEHRGGTCLHIYAVGLARAKRRGGRR